MRGRARIGAFAMAAAGLSACAGGPSATRAPDPRTFPHDAGLFAVLAGDPGPEAEDSLVALEARSGLVLTDTLAEVAEDTSLHPLLRANAVLLLGRRHPAERLIVLGPLLDARDERIRLAAVMALRSYLPGRPEPAAQLLARALRDPSPAVQARVLETVADRDVALLRAYLAAGPSPELGKVAGELVMVAEQRGAPSVPDSAGVLERIGPGGHRLLFRPRTAWPHWEAAVGRLELVPAEGAPVTLGEDVEVSRNVVPAFFSPDGRYVVYENARQIVVRDVWDGTDRSVGAGVAPRPLPFSEDFVFFREMPDSRTETGAVSRFRYEALRAPFAAGQPGEPAPAGRLTATVRLDVAGGASPVRWSRVAERDGEFVLQAEGLDPFTLPDPFASGG